MPISRERFFLGHSVISNKTPKVVSVKDFNNIHKDCEVDLASLGLFEVSAPDFNKYYPDVKPADLVPKDEDYSYPLFRALSNIIVNKQGPIEFPESVLKASVKKLISQAVYTNHEQVVGNEVGVVMDAFWEELRRYEGFKIPGGINVKLKLDGKSNPKLVRSINGDPPSVHSVSVTISFKWVKSHPEMTDDEFWSKLGETNAKNELIRRIVEEILSYEEISLVPHGADPYAQKIGEDGKLVNPGYADNKYQFTAEDFIKNGHYFDWKEYLTDKINLNEDTTIPSPINHNSLTQKETDMNDKTLKALIAKFKLDDKATEADVMVALDNAIANGAEVTRLTTELKTANDALTALKNKYPEGTEILTEDQKAKLLKHDEVLATATEATKNIKAEALKLYHLTCGGADKAEAGITKMIAEASYETSVALFKQYKKTAEDKFTTKCGECGSTNITRASAETPAAGVIEGQSGGNNTVAIKSNQEVIQNLSKSKSRTSGIHGETAEKK